MYHDKCDKHEKSKCIMINVTNMKRANDKCDKKLHSS